MASVEGQIIRIDGEVPRGLRVGLSDRLVDWDRAVAVSVNGSTVFDGHIWRTAECIAEALDERYDLPATPTACGEFR
ncbi:MAG: hypothetical protein ABI073_13720 [Luteolibacter sp.]